MKRRSFLSLLLSLPFIPSVAAAKPKVYSRSGTKIVVVWVQNRAGVQAMRDRNVLLRLEDYAGMVRQNGAA